jgi:hypothetical protein
MRVNWDDVKLKAIIGMAFWAALELLCRAVYWIYLHVRVEFR